MKTFPVDPDAPISARRFANTAPGVPTAVMRLTVLALVLMAIGFGVLLTR
jgi:hypothetical protein